MPSKLGLYLQHLNVGVSVYAPDVLLPFWLSANAYLGRQEPFLSFYFFLSPSLCLLNK